MHEAPGRPTSGMLALNSKSIIKGAKHFVPPPPTKDVYKVVTKSVVHRDPLVAAASWAAQFVAPHGLMY